MVVFIYVRIELWLEIRGYISVLAKTGRRRTVTSFFTCCRHTLSPSTRGRSGCTMKTGIVTIPMKVLHLQLVLGSFYMCKVCWAERNINIYTIKHPLTWEAGWGKYRSPGAPWRRVIPSIPFAWTVMRLWRKELRIRPHPFVIPNSLPEDLFIPASGRHFISSARQSQSSPTPSCTRHTPDRVG